MVDPMADPDVTVRFNEIYDCTYKPVMSYITAKCSNTADIHDIAQDTYVELYQLLEKRGTEYVQNAKALVLKIARQKLSRYYSLMERLRLLVPLTAINEDGEEVELPELTDSQVNSFLVEEFTANQILLEEAQRVLAQKSQDVKKVFYLFYGVGLTIPEIAQLLKMSQSNVKHKLYRTLNELRTIEHPPHNQRTPHPLRTLAQPPHPRTVKGGRPQ